jgi:hypothetical protein
VGRFFCGCFLRGFDPRRLCFGRFCLFDFQSSGFDAYGLGAIGFDSSGFLGFHSRRFFFSGLQALFVNDGRGGEDRHGRGARRHHVRDAEQGRRVRKVAEWRRG